FRSLDHRLSADRRTYNRSVRPVPRERQLQPDQREHGMRQLPPERFPGHDAAQPCAVRIPANLSAVPQHDLMDERDLRSLDDRLPADWRAYHPAVRAVPRERELQPDQREHGLRQLPPERFRGHDESQPRQLGIPADLSAMPQHNQLAE